jgi:hypothetical protein
MDTLPYLALAGAAILGALAGASACYFPMSRAIAALRERLDRSEQARNGAVERSANAREQIAQLNRAITELRRAHSAHTERISPRELAEKALAAGDEKRLVLPQGQPMQSFADTEVMSKL